MVNFDFVIVGGGISGICCAENLCILNESKDVAVITSSPLIKKVVNYKKLGRVIEDFDVAEADAESIENEFPRLKVILGEVTGLDALKKLVILEGGSLVKYDKLCICTGAVPKVISEKNPCVLGIRDTGSAKRLQECIENAKRVIIVGNGGIAMETAYEITGCEVIWIVREDSINVVFLDPEASQFVLSRLQSNPVKSNLSKRSKYTIDYVPRSQRAAALGPDWHESFSLASKTGAKEKIVSIIYNTEVDETVCPENVSHTEKEKLGIWPVYVRLLNGNTFGADAIISATGVKPETGVFIDGNNIKTSKEDGGILVDSEMRTSQPDIYAAGDICTPKWKIPTKWMRLWSQARLLGVRAAQCMTEHANAAPGPIDLDIAMELFTHTTRFCGFKVVLLGRFNGKGLKEESYSLVRVQKDKEYVKVVIANGRLVGAVLIGETDLEETFENLMLNETDVSAYGENLLDPNIDLADYFD